MKTGDFYYLIKVKRTESGQLRARCRAHTVEGTRAEALHALADTLLDAAVWARSMAEQEEDDELEEGYDGG